MSAYINTVCAQVTNNLGRLNKEILTPEDVTTALKAAGIDSTDGRQNYTKGNGYLTGGGWLMRCIGGWTITSDADTTGMITIKVVPGKATGRVHKLVEKALSQYEDVAEIRVEV